MGYHDRVQADFLSDMTVPGDIFSVSAGSSGCLVAFVLLRVRHHDLVLLWWCTLVSILKNARGALLTVRGRDSSD